MDNTEFINTKALEAFKDLLAKYERGELTNVTMVIDNCTLSLKPLGLNDDE